MNNSIRPHLAEALNLIKSNIYLLLIPIVIVFAPYLFLISPNKTFGSALSSVSRLLLIIVYPLIYGKFISIINGVSRVSWGQLFVLHWWNYFIVKLILNIPSLFLVFINLLFNLGINILVGTTSTVIDILSIYIFPIVFIEYLRLKSIPLGVKCLFGNFKFSLPLIFISILPILFVLLPRNPSTISEFSLHQLLSALPQWIFAVVIDFTVFITASLILKDKLYRNRN